MLKSKFKISGTWIATFILFLVPSIVYGDKFFNATNIFNVLRQMSMIGLISIGMTCVILTAGIDLSVGATVAIGGTLLSGGVGGVEKTLPGVLITALIGNIINLQGNLNTYVQQIITGAIVLVVIIIQRKTQAKEV